MATRVGNPAIATYIKRQTSTSQIKRKTRGSGIADVGGVLYVNLGSGVMTLAQALAASIATTPTTVNVGAVSSNGGTVSAVESGDGINHQTLLTFTALPLTLVSLSTFNGKGSKIYTFPQGVITILGASGSVAETTTSILANTLNLTKTYNWGLGTTTQVNSVLATTEQDIIPTSNGVSSTTINVAGAASSGVRVVAPAVFNGNATAIPVFFNVGVATDADIDANATTLWTGSVRVTWTFNGVV